MGCCRLWQHLFFITEPRYWSMVPKIQDVFCMLGILNALGADCRMEENRLVISAVSLSGARIPEILAGQMRSSVMLLGPLLARLGQVETSLPGGCRIGRRPVDLHFLGLTALGASVEKQNGMIRAVCPSGGLSGARIHLPYPSVGATENILMAAAGARGETVLTGAAREPGNRNSVRLFACHGCQGGGRRHFRDKDPRNIHI